MKMQLVPSTRPKHRIFFQTQKFILQYYNFCDDDDDDLFRYPATVSDQTFQSKEIEFSNQIDKIIYSN